MRRSRSLQKLVVLLAVAAVVAAGCGSSNSGTTGAGTPARDSSALASQAKSGLVGDQPSATPVDGGSITVGEFTPVQGLDPTKVTGSGNAGGIELAAIYSVLMRWDPATGKYEGQLAKSVTPNADNTVWTLKLRPGVKFTDGTPLDADAVVFNMKRQTASKSRAGALLSIIASYETPDATTVVFHLKHAWAGFPFALSWMGGMIGSPTAIKNEGDAFNTKPVGAGPFKLKTFAANEKLVLVRNPDYWAGKPHLDQITFTYLRGANATLQALQSGEFQVAFLRDAQATDKARQAGYPGYLSLKNAGVVVLINNGARGQDRPTADVRVRKAIALTLDPKALAQRVDRGAGFPTSDMMGPGSRWHTRSTLEHDPAKAKSLVAQVKKETGWDGTLSLVTSGAQSAQTEALSIQAELNAVGFKIKIDTVTSTADLIRAVNIDANYDLAAWGFNIDEAAPYISFDQFFRSNSPANAMGYKNPKMDQLIDQLRADATPQATQKTLDQIQALWDQTMPSVVLGQQPEFVAWSPKVHGIVPTVTTMVLFGKAFITK